MSSCHKSTHLRFIEWSLPQMMMCFPVLTSKKRNIHVHLYFQLCTHLLCTNLATEPFAVSAWRNLASPHPIFKLLLPHIKDLLACNTIRRKELLGEGGVVDQTLSLGGGGHMEFMERCFKKVCFLYEQGCRS